MVKYAGTEFVASPQQVQATSNYLTEDKPSKQGGLGATSVALICVFIALTVVIIAIVVIMVSILTGMDSRRFRVWLSQPLNRPFLDSKS